MKRKSRFYDVYKVAIPLYKQKKITRKEIVKRYNIYLNALTTYMVINDIIIWDRMGNKKKKQKKKKRNFYKWCFNTKYGKMILNYNVG